MFCPNCSSKEVIVSQRGNSGVYWLRKYFCLRVRCKICSERFFVRGLLLGVPSGLIQAKRSNGPRGENMSLDEDRTDLAENAKALHDSLHALEDARQALAEDRQELREIRAALERDRDDLAQTTRTLAEQMSNLNQLHQEMANQQFSITTSLETVHSLQCEIDQVSCGVSEHANELRQMGQAGEADRSELDRLGRQLDKHRNELEEIKNECAQDRQELGEFRRAFDEGDDRKELGQNKESRQVGRVNDPELRSRLPGDVEQMIKASEMKHDRLHVEPKKPRIQFRCPHCSKMVRVRARYAGKKGICKACSGTLLIPDLEKPSA